MVDISSQHRSESDDEFSWDIKDQKNNSNLPSAPLEEVQDVTEIDVDSPDIEFNKENAQLLMNTFSEVYSKEEKTEIYDSYVTSSITVSKKNQSFFFKFFAKCIVLLIAMMISANKMNRQKNHQFGVAVCVLAGILPNGLAQKYSYW